MIRSAPPKRRLALGLSLLALWLSGCATGNELAAPVHEVGAPPRADGPSVPPPSVEAEPVPLAPASTAALPVAVPAAPAVALPPPAPRDSRSRLLGLLPPGVPDRTGWAADIHAAFGALHLPATPENFCAAIAVIEQVSGFQADPVVPGLSRIVWREIDARRARYGIPRLALDAALLLPSPDGRSYKARIDALRTEKQMNALFEDMVAALPYGQALFADRNPVRTGGAMQVSFAFAEAHARAYPYPRRGSLRDEVFSRRGGVYFGIANLLAYPAPYTQAIYRFADFNAGRYSSRNAAFQAALARVSGRRIVPDGDLLRYEDGAPAREASATQRALLGQAKRLGLSPAAILRDLKREKTAAFAQTPLYRRVFALADARAGRPVPREALPRIRLKSPKIHSRITTEWFAQRVDLRYRGCLARDTGPT